MFSFNNDNNTTAANSSTVGSPRRPDNVDGGSNNTVVSEMSFEAAETTGTKGSSSSATTISNNNEFAQAQSHWESRLGTFKEPDDRDRYDNGDGLDDEESDMDAKDPERRVKRSSDKKNTSAIAATCYFWTCRRRVLAPLAVLLFLLLVTVMVLTVTPRNDKNRNDVVSSSSSLIDNSDNENNSEGAAIGLADVVEEATDVSNEEEAAEKISVSASPSSSSSAIPSSSSSALPTSSSSAMPTVDSSTVPSVSSSTAPTSFALPAWEQTAELSDESASEPSFGQDVSLAATGQRMAVGVPGHDNGRVRIYERSSSSDGNGEWTLATSLTQDFDSWSNFGSSVRLSASGKSLAVRTLRKGIVLGGAYAMVYRYDDDFDEWRVDPRLYVSNPNTAESDRDESQSAMAFSGDGNTLALATTAIDSGNEREDMSLITLVHNSVVYTIVLSSTIHHSDHYLSLSYDGDRIAFADQERVHVKQYHEINSFLAKWVDVGAVLESEDSDVDFGSSVVLSPCGNYLAVSSRGNTKVYVAPVDFDPENPDTDSRWTRLGNTIPNSDDDHDGPPASVSLWSQKMTIVDDNNNNDREETLVTLALSDSGSVRVLQYNTGGSGDYWTGKGDDVDLRHSLEESHREGFGSSVSVSQDGRTVAVGAPAGNDDEGSGSGSGGGGKVLVYQLD